MNKDIIIGIVLSFLIHAFFLMGGHLFPGAPDPVKPEPPRPAVEIFKMPDIDPPDRDPMPDGEKADTPPVKIAPPKQDDIPAPFAPEKDIAQPLQPPAPSNVDQTLAAIPTGYSIGGDIGGTLFTSDLLDQVPQATYQPPPQYPHEAKRAGLTGSALVGFIVDTNGDVRDAHVIRSSSPGFEEAALQAIRKWRFRPGVKGGRNVNTKMNQPFSFTLNSD